MNDFIRAEITDKDDASGRWLYAWTERTQDFTDGSDIEPIGARFGELDNGPAVEINDAEVDVGTIVFLRQRGAVDEDLWWEFSHTDGGGSSALTTDQVALGSQYTITADNTLQTVGTSFSLTIPATGTYLVWGEAIASAKVSALGTGAACGVAFELYVNASDTGIGAVIALAPVANVTFDGSAFSQRVDTYTAGDVITMKALRDPNSGGTFTVSTINTSWRGTLGQTRMGYMKIG